MTEVAQLKRWPLASVWPTEAGHLNPWLGRNLDILNQVLPPDWHLASAKVQQVAGSLFVDVLAQTSDEKTVIVEAQFGQSDHDHLGKLLTYVAVYGAGAAIWIVDTARPEHLQAVTKLNGRGLADFFMVRLEVVSIGEGGPKAPLFTVLTGPSAVLKTAGAEQAQLSERGLVLKAFWTELLATGTGKLPLGYANKQPRATRRLAAPTNTPGIRLFFELRRHDSSCAVVILGGHSYGDPGPVFHELFQHKSAVEAAFGAPLKWVPGVRPRVRLSFSGGYQDKTEWAVLQGQLIDGMQRLGEAVAPALASLETRPPSKGLAEDDDQGDVDEPEEAEGGS